jgi:hypothetical protein
MNNKLELRRLLLITCAGFTLLAASLARADHVDRMVDGPFKQDGAGNQDAFGSPLNILGSIRDVTISSEPFAGQVYAQQQPTRLLFEPGAVTGTNTLTLGYGLPFGGGSFTADFIQPGVTNWNSVVVRLSVPIGASGTLTLTVNSGDRQFTFAPQKTPVQTSVFTEVDEYTFFYSEDGAKTVDFRSIDGVRLSFTTSSAEAPFSFKGIILANSAQPSPSPSPTASPSPSPTASPSPSATPANTSTLLNISTRLRVLTDENVLIGGFIITGNINKRVILRAVGPSLTSDGAPVGGRLLDPTIELFDGDNQSIIFNDDWKDSPDRGEIENSGVRPGDDREPAIARTLAPGRYTAVVRGQNNSAGIAVVETYDRDNGIGSKLANISTRGFVGTGDNVMIGGFITGSQNGGTRVLVRAIGPSLKSTIAAAMSDPVLELKDQNGQTVRANDNWKENQRQEIEETEAAPSDDAESALSQRSTPATTPRS